MSRPWRGPLGARRARSERYSQSCGFVTEKLERRVLLSSAIAAFGLEQTFAAGTGPHSLVLADFNRDGKLDAIFANSSDIGVMLGNGNGTFAPPQTFADGGLTPLSIAVADVNRDGKPDIISANSTNVSVLLGNGDGTFAAPQTFDAGPHAASVAVADVNRDGKPDIIVTNIDSQGTVSVLLGNGDGTFQPRQTFASGPYSLNLAVTDVNGDGKSDLIVAHTRSNDLAVLLGNGDGTFQPMQTIATGNEGNAALAVADLNDDGKLDLVLTDYFDDSVGVLLGNGDGTFKPEATFAVGAEPQALADVNGDGKPDLLIAYAGNGDVGALVGNGDGTFQPAASFPIGAPLSTHSLAIADVNGDGRQDLIVTNYNGGTLGVLLGDVPPTVLSIDRTTPRKSITGDPSVSYTVTFSEVVSGVDASDFSLAATGNFTATQPVDVSGSGAVYTVTVNGIAGTGTLGLNLDNNGTIKDLAGNPLQIPSFQPAMTVAAGRTTAIAVADLNGDGKPDLVVGNLDANTSIGVLIGNGDGTFHAQQTIALYDPSTIRVADLNGDGRPDLAVGTYTGIVEVLLGNGNGTFQPPQQVGLNLHDIALADLNHDGRLDLVGISNADSPGRGAITVMLGNGNGTFQKPQSQFVGGDLFDLQEADVNGDGQPDLVLANYLNSGSVDVMLGNGNGTFAPAATFAADEPRNIQIADVNGDGKPDLLVCSYETGAIGILLGNGDGTFAAEQTSAVSRPWSITVSDVNGDGKPDLIAPSYGSSLVSILYGNGDGTFQPPQTLAANTPNVVAVADLNADGRPDLIATERRVGGINVWLGESAPVFAGQVYTIQTQVISIDRATPVIEFTSATSVSYTVTFSTNVTGVAAGDFKTVTTGAVDVGGPLVVTPVSASVYTVTVGSIHGEGTVELDFIDNGTIKSATGNPLRGPAGSNDSFQGQQYEIAGQVGPQVLLINRESPISPVVGDGSMQFLVMFNESVTGVDPSDFQVATTGNVSYASPLEVSGSGSMYSVTVNGVTGGGSIGLNLIDPSDIRDLAGIPLSQPGTPIVFQAQQTLAIGGTAPYSVVMADLNGDGRADAVVINHNSNSVSVLLGNGNGTFAAPQTYAVGSKPVSLAVADVNGDGIPDLVVGNSYAPAVGAFASSVSVLLGNGNGTFKAQATFATYGSAAYMAVADLNGDGKPDIVVEGVGRDLFTTLGVLFGNGDGTFQPEGLEAYAGQGAGPGLITDINGDGVPDAVFTYKYQPNVLLGNGNGTFRYDRISVTGYSATSTVVADVNGDGKPDLIFIGHANPSNPNQGNAAVVLLGNGDGTFQSPRIYAVGSNPDSLGVADFNGDGNLDLIVGNRGDNTFSVLLGNGDGTFQPQQTFAAGSGPTSIAVADLNGDLRPDLLIANASGNSLSVLLRATTVAFTGETYNIVQTLDTITGTAGTDDITLTQDPDHAHVDWQIGSTYGQLPINDPNGLTINGNGGNDTIALNYAYGDPLSNSVHLNGAFTINGLMGTNPLAGTTLDIGRSTVFISYSATDPIAAIQGYLQAGYNAGAWNGAATASTGSITSAAAQTNPNRNTAIGYADSSDGQGVNTLPNSIELAYTLYGDANLDHQVNSADLQILLASLNRAGGWDQGDFNYDGQVNSADLQALLSTLNTSLGNQAATVASSAAAPVVSPPPKTGVSSPAASAHTQSVAPSHRPVASTRAGRRANRHR